MAQPVLVRTYSSPKPTPAGSPSGRSHVLPPIAAFSFADILRSADGAEFQSAIDGIAKICAKNRMSLAEEYGSHLPPVGEITATSMEIVPIRQTHGKPNMRRALTSVPEASSGSSEGSTRSKRRGILGFGSRQEVMKSPLRTMRIGSTGRTISICGTTAVSMGALDAHEGVSRATFSEYEPVRSPDPPRSAAVLSLRQLMDDGDARP